MATVASSSIPVVRAKLGGTLLELESESSYKIEDREISTVGDPGSSNVNQMLCLGKVFVFEYVSLDTRMVLPPGRFLAANFVDKTIYQIRVCPQIRYASFHDSMLIVNSIRQSFLNSGWPFDKVFFDSANSIREFIARRASSSDTFSLRLFVHVKANVMATVSLERLLPQGLFNLHWFRKRYGNRSSLYNVTVVFSDYELHRALRFGDV